MKKQYELTVILPVETSQKEATGLVEGLLARAGGKITASDFWGKKDLVYPIKKRTSAIYAHFKLQMESSEAVEIEKRLRLEENVVRYLLVAVEKPVIKESKKKSNGSSKSK